MLICGLESQPLNKLSEFCICSHVCFYCDFKCGVIIREVPFLSGTDCGDFSSLNASGICVCNAGYYQAGNFIFSIIDPSSI
jgi:hypothetical protein